MRSEGSLFVNFLAWETVLSLEWPSTTMTSKSWRVCSCRSLSRLGRYFSSLRVGMMIEKNGFFAIDALY
jgi:hypothetical protein